MSEQRWNSSSRNRLSLLLAALALLFAGPLRAQEPAKIAIIDVGRILEESEAGQAALAEIKALQDQTVAKAEVMQQEAEELRKRVEDGRLSLSEDRLADLQQQFQDKMIALKRLEDDSNRQLKKVREARLGEIERRVMPVINQVGTEFGYTLMFNKFQSGLVYAKEEIDITDLILERFDQASADNEQ